MADPLHQALARFHAAGGRVRREGLTVLLDTTPHSAPVPAVDEAEAYLRINAESLQKLCVPAVTPKQADSVRILLSLAGAIVTYITELSAATEAVAALRTEYLADLTDHGRSVIGLDVETEVLPELRQPVPVRFTKQGRLAVRQPKDGVAGLALDPFSSRVRLCQMWVSGAVRVFDMRHVPWSVFDPLFSDPQIAWAAFAAGFEAKRLLCEVGRLPAGRFYDARPAVWLTDGQLPDLEGAAKVAFGLTVPKVLGASDWSADPLSQEQLEYAALDAVLVAALWHQQREIFEATDPDAETAQHIADDAIEATARAELQGVGFDKAAHEKLLVVWETELAAVRQKREKKVPGLKWSKRTALQNYLTDALSGDAAFESWPRTKKTRLLCTNRSALVQAKHIKGIAEHVEVLRLEKLLNSFGADLAAKVNQKTGRLHTGLIIAGARTGRFSSRDPNMQQLPKRRSKVFRSVIVAAPGKLLMASDFSQAELRAVAEIINVMVGRSQLREGFLRGLDAHLTTALLLTGKDDPAEVTKEERDQAKAPNFGLTYGMGRHGFFNYVRDQYQPNITVDAAYDLYDAMHEAYPELGEWHALQERQCRWEGFVGTPMGRRWYWKWMAREEEEIDYDLGFVEDQRTGFERNYAFNHPVQGGCAEVMLLAMARVDRALRPYPARICLTVHDELLIELSDDPSVISDVRAVVVEAMSESFLHVFPDAPTIGLVDPTVGRNWGEQMKIEDWLKDTGVTQ